MAQKASHAVGTLATALDHANKLLNTNPRLAAAQAAEILHVIPDQPGALMILSSARRRQGDAASALPSLERLAHLQPAWADAHHERGLTLAVLGRSVEATAALKQATVLDPRLSDAWRALGDQYTLAGDVDAADAAYAQQIRHATRNPALMEAAAALCDNRLAIAERLLKSFLKQQPTDVVAIRMLAELASRLGRYGDAETLLARCLELAPGFTAARANYAFVLQRQNKAVDAIEQLDRLLEAAPGEPSHLMLKAASLVQIGRYAEAIQLYERVLASYPNQPKSWTSYGHALKTEGRTAESIAAYRRALQLQPAFGEAYWSLANLKTFRFAGDELAAMRAQLERADLADDDRLHCHFALGKALEDAGEWVASFDAYRSGNAIRRRQLPYDRADTSARIARARALFDQDFFAKRSGAGSASADPIFIVGLPRSGSTLIEQILASHSQVEGTMELPDLTAMAKRLGGRLKRGDVSRYPEILGELTRAELTELGEEYLDRTRIQRKTDRPYFIDKMPNNFLHVGMIHLILPRATIIDARRHPIAACFSNFKQHFARGQAFSYDLTDLGRYYADYVELMAQFDRVLPGRVHRVQYETMVGDTEAEIRRLLDHCGLTFEPGCLDFWRNDRSVRTASAEQVRRPIFGEAVDHWRHYEPWLDPLKLALADCATTASDPLTPRGASAIG